MNNVNLKSALIIITTLVTGIAIGFELSEISIKNRFEKIDSFKEPQGFVRTFEEIIMPDNDQKVKVGSILLKYHNKIDKVTKSGMNEISLKMDSMAVELKQILNEEQQARLNEEMQRMKRMPPPHKMDRNFPPGGERMPPPGNPVNRGPLPPPERER
jgi:hypothetical protein